MPRYSGSGRLHKMARASTIAGGDGSRQPSKVELDAARYQGDHVAKIAARLAG